MYLIEQIKEIKASVKYKQNFIFLPNPGENNSSKGKKICVKNESKYCRFN